MEKNLKTKVIKSVLWSFLERLGQQGIQLIVTIIMARLLLPEEFGLIAMLTIFLAVSQSFMESGFGAALIQKQNASYTDECSVFYFNIFMGFVLAGIMCLVAPSIAVFYNQEVLVHLTYAMSLNVIINSFGLIQSVLLVKNIDFKTQFKVSTIATVISGTLGVLMALNSFGVWSLVVLYISNSFIRTVLFWVIGNWRPSFIFKFASLKEMFSFGSRIFVIGLIDAAFQNIYFVVIGKIISPISLGFYYYAHKLQQLPVQNISTIVGRVTFPVFSSLQDNQIMLKQSAKKALSMQVFFNFPLLIGLAIIARPMIIVVLTNKWIQSVQYLQLLCFAGLLYPIYITNLNIIKSQGFSDLFFKFEIVNKLLIALALVITYRWGVVPMIYGQIVTSVIISFFSSYFSGKMINYSVFDQIKDFFPSLLITIIMGSGMLLFNNLIYDNELILLIFQIIFGFVSYSFLSYVFKVSSFMDLINIVKSKNK
jgi:O-antigen/teichoic acid export membrane protein